MRRIAAWMPACAIATAVLMGGCGGSSGNDATAGTAERTAPASTPAPSTSATADPCALLTAAEIAGHVKNPVNAGTRQAGPGVCKWDTENPDHVSVNGQQEEAVLKAAASALATLVLQRL